MQSCVRNSILDFFFADCLSNLVGLSRYWFEGRGGGFVGFGGAPVAVGGGAAAAAGGACGAAGLCGAPGGKAPGGAAQDCGGWPGP